MWYQHRTEGLQLRTAGNLLNHRARPIAATHLASYATDRAVHNTGFVPGSSEVLANSQPPSPNNIPQKVAAGGWPWGVGVSEKLWEVHKHLVEEMMTWSNTTCYLGFSKCPSLLTRLQMIWRGGEFRRHCGHRWNSSFQRERETVYGQRGRAIHCSGQYINRHKSKNNKLNNELLVLSL